MIKRLLSAILTLFLALSCLPCGALGAESDGSGPLSEAALPSLCDTGRGYILYYWYASAIYYSEDKVTWTDLSDRQWVQDAAGYCYSGVGHLGHREFELLWTGTEYMMRQSLLDDPRSAYQRRGDSPRNCLVTFLDEAFQVIGEVSFDGPVTGIRCEDGTYYATVGGVENAFSRQAWASDAPFRDVAPDDWFAPYVEVCCEAGLMEGIGDGLFNPDGTVSYAETAILTARIHQILNGGDGVLPAAPEDWGTITMTTHDGTQLSACCDSDGPYGWGSWRHDEYGYLYYTLPDERKAWAESQSGLPAVAEADGETYSGMVELFLPLDSWVLAFHPDGGDDSEAGHALHDVLYLSRPGPDKWYRDAAFYLESAGLGEIPSLSYSESAAPRAASVQTLASVTGELLTPVNQISDFPDSALYSPQKADILAFYNAGILTGVDPQGTFDGDKPLTRAEAAAMLARIIRPDLRVSFTPAP